jgi:integrase
MTTTKTRGKRLNREGSTPKQAANGKWRSTVMLGYTPEGKRLRKTVTADTAAECRQGIAALVQAYEHGATIPSGKATNLADYLAWYFQYAQDNELVRVRTLEGYRSKARNYVDTTRLGKIRLNRLTPADFETQYRHMRANGLSISTVRQLHAILRKALSHAVKHGIMLHNPTLLASLPKPSKREQRTTPGHTLTITEARRLFAAAENSENPARWLIGTLLGLRQSEVLALAWDRINLDAGTLTVDRGLYRLTWQHGCTTPCGAKRGADCPHRHSGGLHVGDPKSENSFRTIPLPDQITTALRDQQAKHATWAVQDGHRATWTCPEGETLDLVFKQRNGRPVDLSTDAASFKTLLAEAGLEPMRVHDMRHTAATMLLVQGIDPQVVMKIMGWSQTSMLTRYQHVLLDLQTEALNKVTTAITQPVTDDPEPSNVIGLHQWKEQRHG